MRGRRKLERRSFPSRRDDLPEKMEMKVKRGDVTREEVIRFYVAYDWRKKNPRRPLPDIDTWTWHDPDALDGKLAENGLKKGVLAAYRTWQLVEFDVADILESAIVDQISPKEPQALGQLVLRGKLAEWFPKGAPEWWREIGSGSELGAGSALILRRSVPSERPAKWCIEDGSGRALALLQRILRYGEVGRTAWAYLGHERDDRSAFIKLHPELT
jgi:hypothetical protein